MLYFLAIRKIIQFYSNRHQFCSNRSTKTSFMKQNIMIISHQITRPARRKWSGASKEGCTCGIHVFSINNASIVEINAWMKSKMKLLHSSDKRIPLTIFKMGIEKQHFQRTIIANMVIVAILWKYHMVPRYTEYMT